MSTLRVLLEAPSSRRERDYLDAAHRSRELHRGLVTVARTPEDYGLLLERVRQPTQTAFFVVIAVSGELAGVVSFSDIDRNRALSASIGYYAFQPHAGHGYMREGLVLAIDEAFGSLGLARLGASVQPKNRRSVALVRGLVVTHVGRCAYLKVGARWRPHERWELRCEDWQGAGLLFGGDARVAER